MDTSADIYRRQPGAVRQHDLSRLDAGAQHVSGQPNPPCWCDLAGWMPVLAALVSSPPLQRAAVVGGMAGHVYDQRTGQPIQGIHVKTEGQPYEAHTDSAGFYNIQNVPVGSYILWADDNDHNPIRYAQHNQTVTVAEGFTTFVDFDLAPLGTAIGFFMQVDFDPSSWPTAKYWYADINDLIVNWFLDIQLNPDALWDGSSYDMSEPHFASQTLTSELYDANYNLLVRRIVPLGGAAGPLVMNGHSYAFNINQAHLYDMGPF